MNKTINSKEPSLMETNPLLAKIILTLFFIGILLFMYGLVTGKIKPNPNYNQSRNYNRFRNYDQRPYYGPPNTYDPYYNRPPPPMYY